METPYLDIHTAAGRRQLVLGKEPISIGRHSQNKLVVPGDNMVSRFHCVIERVADGYLLRDLGASNGTLVNGKEVKSALLMPGDVVKVGSTELVLVIPDDSPGLEDLEQAVEQIQREEPQVDVLSESDVIEDSDEAIPPPAIEIEETEDFDYEHVLRRLAEGAPSKPFGEGDIALINPRGSVVHPAGRAAAGKSRTITDLFRLLLLVCFRGRATDIHIEPKEKSYAVRIRIDGVLVDAVRLPTPVGIKLLALVKVLSDIDPSQKTVIQEGHFTARVPGLASEDGVPAQPRRVDYRLSFAPAVLGQKLVIRVLDTAGAPARIKDLNLPSWMQEELTSAINQGEGMVLVCGPTGSGKTTSIYALLRSIQLRERNVVTIEDPVEIQIDGVTQLPVDEEKGKSFAELLRSVLRQDPDVILVGEIRDAETARTAMQASITGHMVFSTVHTKDTFGTIFRLLDLGVEPYLLAQGLQVVLAQRLVRQLCPNCKVAQVLTPQRAARMGKAGENVNTIYAPGGCHRCMSTGYAGRRGIYELLSATEALRDAIIRGATPAEMQKAAEQTNFVRLQHNGHELVAQGLVAYEEIERVVGR